jgi:S1-C subfamily serine protease
MDGITGDYLPDRTVYLDGSGATTDQNGTAVFRLSLNKSGGFVASFKGDGSHEASKSSKASITIIPLSCEDGTLPGECSGSYLCKDLELEFDCERCGCPAGLLCEDNECITEEQRLQRLIVELQRSDVLVENDIGTGSGIIIEDRWVLTARHVVDPEFNGIAAANIEIFNSEREIAKPQRILLAPNDIDLAVIVINKDMGIAADFGSDGSIERGAGVLAIGSPLGLQDSVTRGIVSNFYDAETDSGYGYQAIQIDAPVNPGNSGGGLFLESNGKLIGVTTFKRVISRVELAEGLGFAVPLTLLEEFPVDDWQPISPG